MRKCNLPSLGEGVYEEDFEAISETWNTYKLKSGTLIKVKSLVTSVVRFDGAKRPDGQSSYFVNIQNIIDYFPPEEQTKGGIVIPDHEPDKILS